MADLLFTRRANLGSSIIRAGAWSGWSHVQVVDGAYLWGASFPQGVIREPFSHRIAQSSRAMWMSIPVPDEDAVIAFARSQKGTPYDFWGALGLGFHRDWQDPSRWWCSEFAAAAVHKGGRLLFRDGAINRVTPEHLSMQPFAIQMLK